MRRNTVFGIDQTFELKVRPIQGEKNRNPVNNTLEIFSEKRENTYFKPYESYFKIIL